MFTLDSVVPRFPLTCVARNDRDIAICSPNGLYILEDFGLSCQKRRYWPLPNELRAIIYSAPNQTTLIGLSSDGRFIWFLDTLEQRMEIVMESGEDDKFTCIRMKDADTVLIGTFNGILITKSIRDSSCLETKAISTNPISFIIDEGCQADSSGRHFLDNQIVVDDGILQPCALFQSDEFIYFVKNRNIYIVHKNYSESPIKIVHLESSAFTYFSAAELDFKGTLYICTDSGEIYHLDANAIKLKLLKSSGLLESSDSTDSEGSDVEDEGEMVLKSERILGLIQNPNRPSELLLLKTDPVNKRAWFDFIKIESTAQSQVHTPVPEFETVSIICPLCSDTQKHQSLKLNTTACLYGHPITISSQTRKLLEPVSSCFRCRSCKIVYSTQPPFCQFCSNLITK